MIGAKTACSVSMPGLSRRSKAGNGGACLKGKIELIFEACRHSFAPGPAPPFPQARFAWLCARLLPPQSHCALGV